MLGGVLGGAAAAVTVPLRRSPARRRFREWRSAVDAASAVLPTPIRAGTALSGFESGVSPAALPFSTFSSAAILALPHRDVVHARGEFVGDGFPGAVQPLPRPFLLLGERAPLGAGEQILKPAGQALFLIAEEGDGGQVDRPIEHGGLNRHVVRKAWTPTVFAELRVGLVRLLAVMADHVPRQPGPRRWCVSGTAGRYCAESPDRTRSSASPVLTGQRGVIEMP
jgi:hypothetical protein